MVIIGDMNVNIIGVHENNNNNLNIMLSESAFISFINVYTRLPEGFNHSCLDHIFINSNENVASKINAGVILTDCYNGSDITVRFVFLFQIPLNAYVVNNRKFFSIIDYNLITSILANENWTEA